MNKNKKAAEVGKPQAALTTFHSCNSNSIPKTLKVAVYRLAPWIIFLGRLHG